MSHSSYNIIDMFTGEPREVDYFIKKFSVAKGKPIGLESQGQKRKPKKSDYATIKEWYDALTEHAQGSKCVCKHPTFENGVCHYMTCYHNIKDHR